MASLLFTVILLCLVAVVNAYLGFFFGAILLSLAVGALTAPLMFWRVYRGYDKAQRLFLGLVSSLLVLSVNFAFLSTVPLNVDRSFSVWVLSGLASSSSERISRSEVQENFESYFLAESAQIERRIDEQLKLGNISVEGECVGISDQGKDLVKLFEIIGNFFSLEEEYFRGSFRSGADNSTPGQSEIHSCGY